ncbi:MAG: CHAT domain-containing protein [Bacteroidia bacterium]|nr:CHAT domain-containing protein [Bacteroidia bacterium]
MASKKSPVLPLGYWVVSLMVLVLFSGQKPADNNQANRLLKSGIKLSRQMQFEAATATLDSVIALSGVIDPLSPVILFARKERAYVEMMQNNIEEAHRRYQELVNDCEKLPPEGDSIRAASYEGFGQVLYYNGEYQQGLAYVEKALVIFERVFKPDNMKLAICQNTLGIMQMYMSMYEEALASFLRSADLLSRNLGENHPDVLQVKTNIGVLYSELGLFWKSLEYHKELIPFLDSLPPSAHLNALLNVGATLITVGDYETARIYFDQAERWLEKFPGMTPESYGYLAFQRSLIYKETNQPERATRSIGEALKRNQEIFGKDHPQLIAYYIQQGILQSSIGKYDSAIISFEKIYQIARQYEGERSLRKGHALFYMGETLARKNDWGAALNRYRQAVESYAANGNRLDQAKTYIRMAEIWREKNSRDSTFALHRRAWEVLLPDIAFEYSPSSKVLRYWQYHPMREMFASQAKSLLHFSVEDQNQAWMEAARICAETAIMVGDSQRYYYETPGSKLYGVRDELPVFEDAIDAAWQLYTLTHDSQYASMAFELTEKSKSGILRDHLRGIEALHFAGVPDTLIEKEQYFRQRLAALDKTRYDPETDSLQAESLENRRFQINQSYKTFLKQLEKQFPGYYQLKFPEKTSAADIGARLFPTKAAYSYFLGEKYLFIFRLFQEKIHFYRVILTDQIEKDRETWLNFITQPPSPQTDADTVFALAFRLTQTLLPDLIPDITQLLIIPDGRLGYLSFESLLTDLPENNDFRTWPFLTRQHSVTYAYAAELWLQQQKKQGKTTAATYLGFAPTFSAASASETRNTLSPLTYNQEEVNQVAKLLRGKTLTGTQAKESAVKNTGTKPVILHFATHAIADEENQMSSRLFFENDTTAGEDGVLYAGEIYGLNLNSPLAVLSACQTGGGPLQRGEGLMSLARAFQYSGSQNILTTLWKTDDRAGATLTQAFFNFLAKNPDTGQALQNARKQWLSDSDNYHCHPYFWAGYVLIGEGGAVEVKQPDPSLKIWIGLGLVLVLGGIIVMLKRKWFTKIP